MRKKQAEGHRPLVAVGEAARGLTAAQCRFRSDDGGSWRSPRGGSEAAAVDTAVPVAAMAWDADRASERVRTGLRFFCSTREGTGRRCHCHTGRV